MKNFGHNCYYWRRLSPEERAGVLALRMAQHRPWHSPPHGSGEGRFLLTAACYEHASVIGRDGLRLADFENRLLAALEDDSTVQAWVVLPNHYHAVVITDDVGAVLRRLGHLHGRTSFEWNGQESTRGRKVWCSAVETPLRSDRYYHAALNYVHHNPVKHGYAVKWTDWPFSSARVYLETVGHGQAEADWREYDISTMGSEWDP